MTIAAKRLSRVFASLCFVAFASLLVTAANAQTFVQVNSATPTSATQVAVTYTKAQVAGDLNVVIVGWNDTTAVVQSITDSLGNTYVLAAGPTKVTGTLTQSIYYAKSIAGAAAAANAVTVTFSTSAIYPDIRILEYSGLDTASPLDGGTGATGTGTATDSGALTTANANDLLVGANLVSTSTAAPGTGFTQRIVTDPDGDLAEDRVVTATGAYHATSTLAAAGPWITQIVAFKASGAAPAPSAPGNLTATVISSSQINLNWTASTESGGTISSYLVERCQGAGCSNFAQVNTSPTTNFNDTGLSVSTSYSYRVRAMDTTGLTGPYSNTASATTLGSGPPTPTAPGNLTALTGTTAPIVVAVQGYKNATEQVTHTTDPFDSTGGDVIVLCASSHAGVTMTPSDSFGNIWISIAGPTSTTVGDDLRTQVWYARNPTTGPGHTVTMTMSVTQSLVISVIVGKGSNISTPIDAASTVGSDAGTTTVNVQSPNITTTTSEDLLVGFVKSSTGEVFAPGTGFTAQLNASSNFLFAETGSTTTPGIYDATAELTENTTWQSAVVAVSPSPTGGNPNQVTLNWIASTETGGTVANYLVERCQGVGCSTFSQIGMTPNVMYTDTTVSSSTSYSYRVRAVDTASTTGPYSNIVSVTTGGGGSSPTAPTNLTATAASSTEIDLSWSASTESGGTINSYLVERCPGLGCTTFAQVGTSTTTSFSDTGLNGSTGYTYRVRAKDAQSNLGPYSSTASATTLAPIISAPTNPNASAISSTQINVSWTAATETGGTISNYLVERCQGVGCSSFAQIGTSATTTYSDSGLIGSTSYSYRIRATDSLSDLGPYSTVVSATTSAPVFTAPTNFTATAAFSTQINLSWTAATETGGTITSYLVERCQGAGCSSFAQIGTSPTTTYNDTGLTSSTSYSYRIRAQDAASNMGPYSATATATTSAATPTAPTNLTATAASSVQINLSWTASTESGGTIASYLVERCAGAACTSFAQIGSSPTTTFNDTGLTGSTSYSYRVRAQDSIGATGPYSSTASATTAAPVITAPTNLAATAASSVQINLSWTAATETGGTISSYLVERCSGAACTSFAQIGTSATTSFNDTGLTGSTSYSYRVRVKDTAGNMGPYSATATATTAAPVITAPTNLVATAASGTQINLSWTAATETGGTISSYLVERCQGAGCTSFAQVGTSTTTTFGDTGLTASTTYSYRVRVKDAAGNMGPYSATASATTTAAGPPPPITFVQVNSAVPASGASVAVTYTKAQVVGDLNVVIVGWNDTTATVKSIADTKGNPYVLASGPIQVSGTLTQSIYYAKNIVAAAASANKVTVTFSTSAIYPDVRILEYSGIDTVNPFDGGAGATGTATTTDSGALTTAYANDLLIGANIVSTSTAAPGTGFTQRVETNPDGDITEDRVVTATGSYHATATLSAAGPWIIQIVAFRAAGAP